MKTLTWWIKTVQANSSTPWIPFSSHTGKPKDNQAFQGNRRCGCDCVLIPDLVTRFLHAVTNKQ
eukprot:scaffold2103_cov185-Amphora_coffeaeformis.AAC.6